MAAKLWEGCFTAFRDNNDEPASGAQAWFFAAEGSTPITVFSDASLTVPRTQPVIASAAGRFPPIFMAFEDYRVRVADAANVSLLDIDGIENTDPSAGSGGGGGGGGGVSADQIFQTGDVKFLEQDGALTGWVRDNGRTIGNALSGATERANADVANLYAWYYDKYSDAICPVTGGRGASAASDFAAGKPIATLDKRGAAAVGLDTMGNLAANRVQISTTISTTNGQTSAVVASASGLIAGMVVVSANVSPGTRINAISGLTLTLSATATGTASGTAARFSFFSDAQTPGASGGFQAHTNTLDELPSHLHSGTTNTGGTHTHSGVSDALNDHVHPYNDGQAAGVTGAQAGSSFSALVAPVTDVLRSTGGGGAHQHNLIIASDGLHTHTFTTGLTGGSRPHNNLQPGILGTWYRKI